MHLIPIRGMLTHPMGNRGNPLITEAQHSSIWIQAQEDSQSTRAELAIQRLSSYWGKQNPRAPALRLPGAGAGSAGAGSAGICISLSTGSTGSAASAGLAALEFPPKCNVSICISSGTCECCLTSVQCQDSLPGLGGGIGTWSAGEAGTVP